jgi:nucleotide-binding universal stress UspA family protein
MGFRAAEGSDLGRRVDSTLEGDKRATVGCDVLGWHKPGLETYLKGPTSRVVPDEEKKMKILLPTDGSAGSEAALNEVCSRPWPAGTEVEILSAVHTRMPAVPDPFLVGAACHEQTMEQERSGAESLVAKAAQLMREKAPQLRVTTKILEEAPKKAILEEAQRGGTDLIVLGSQGHGPVWRFMLGSVALAVAQAAHCSVEIVRPQREEHPGRKEAQKESMGIDWSKAKWTWPGGDAT